MNWSALGAFGSVIAMAITSSAVDAQNGIAGTWLRVAPQEQTYSVEVPCTADQITHIPPPQVRRRPGDERVTVTCEANGAIYYATLVSVAANAQLPQPLFDLVRGSVASAGTGSRMSMDESIVSERRVLALREVTPEGLAGQSQIIEVNDRSLLFIGIRSGDGGATSGIEDQMARFVGSVEFAL